MIGFAFVLAASLGICFSLNLQKLVHMRNTDPATGEPLVNFMTLPMWWVGSISNGLAELLNLAALGWAPATLVTPLGCLTVVFNAISANVFLGEPWLQRDLFGVFLIFTGVLCVVWSQIGAPSPPITPEYLHEHMLCGHGANACISFWMLFAGCLAGLAVLYYGFHAKYCQRTCWIYLGESSLVACFTVLSARCFASFLPPPMPGKWEYFTHAPDCYYTYGSLLILLVTAVGGLLLQNAALMYFKASEVVPIYFCMFALAGVAGSGLAFGELRMPWLLLLIPGVGFCIAGVFVISHRRDERIAERCALREEGTVATLERRSSAGPGGGGGGGMSSGRHSSARLSAAAGGGGGDSTGASVRASALGFGADSCRGFSELSCASVASAAALEETAFLTLGGGIGSSVMSAYRMSHIARSASARENALTGNSGDGGQASLSASLLAHQALSNERLGRSGFLRGGTEANDSYLPMCRESEASSAAMRNTGGAAAEGEEEEVRDNA